MVFGGVRNGFGLVRQGLRVFGRYPRFAVPLAGVWVILAAIDLHLYFNGLSGVPLIVALPLIAFTFTFLLTFASSVTLELVEQVETGGTPSVRRAFRHTVSRNLLRFLPLVVVWTVVWLVLTAIEAILSSEDDAADTEVSAENAARALTDDASLWSASIDAIKKGVRMLVFLVMPAIAWEGRGFRDALGRGRDVLSAHPTEFATGYSLTGFISFLVFLPAVAVFTLADNGVAIPTVGWYAVITYMGLGWTLTIYLEQLFTAGLFLWHREWEAAVETARENGESRPSLDDVSRPSLFDDEASLAGDHR